MHRSGTALGSALLWVALRVLRVAGAEGGGRWRQDVEDLYYNGYSNNVLWPLFHYIPLSMLAYDENDEQEEQW